MSISLAVGSQNIEADNLGDLKSSVKTLLKIAHPVFESGLDKQVSEFPAIGGPVKLDYGTPSGSWTVGDFTFGLCGGVSGAVGILGEGLELQTYTKTFPTTIGDGLDVATNAESTGTIVVGPGEFYVQVSLDLTIAANAAATVNVGSVGISGSIGSADSFTVSFYKKVDGTILLKDALKAAFEGFVLPLHSGTYQRLQPGDYLYHRFNATLNLGFGAGIGLDKVFYSGQYKVDIPKAPAAPAVNTSVALQVEAGAKFGATFNYTGSYEAMLWKTDDNTGRLHLYRNKVTDANFNVGATVAVIAAPTVKVSPGDLSSLTSKVLPGGTGDTVNKLLAGKAQDAVNGWVNDVQTKITGWLTPFQQRSTALQLAIDNTQANFLLLDFTFELGAVGFPTAWKRAVAGDYSAALAVPGGGVSLDTGSGLENFHKVKTSVTFNLFGAFNAEWDAARIDDFSVQYAGNNTFHLIENIGRSQTATLGKSGREMDFYFAATATSGPAGTTVGDVDLHVVLMAAGNRGFGTSIAGVLSNATTGTVASTLSKQILALAQQRGGSETLKMIFKASAYGRLSSSTLGKMMIEEADRKNFDAFAWACSHVEGSAPANFTTDPAMDYGTWEIWNIAANDAYPPPEGSLANRRKPGNPGAAETYLRQRFGASLPAPLIGYSFLAASDFMNLCEDLKNLAGLVTADAANVSWDALITDLKSIIKNDVAGDFIPATALALTKCVGSAGVQPQIIGPAPNGAQEPSITVTLVYS